MITGRVNNDLEAVIRLRLRGPDDQERDIEAIVDTGFSGSLTVPPEIARGLNLRRVSRGRAIVANGAQQFFDICGVTVSWDGDQRYVETDILNNVPLVGMALLRGFDLLVHVQAGGSVFIDARDHDVS